MKRSLKIGLSARLLHPRADGKGLESKTLQYLEQSVAQWIMARDVLVFMIPSITRDGMLDRSVMRLSDYAKNLDGLVLQGGADKALAGVDWLKHHPAAVAVAVVVLVVASPKRAWRWGKRGFLVWRGWQTVRSSAVFLHFSIKPDPCIPFILPRWDFGRSSPHARCHPPRLPLDLPGDRRQSPGDRRRRLRCGVVPTAVLFRSRGVRMVAGLPAQGLPRGALVLGRGRRRNGCRRSWACCRDAWPWARSTASGARP